MLASLFGMEKVVPTNKQPEALQKLLAIAIKNSVAAGESETDIAEACSWLAAVSLYGPRATTIDEVQQRSVNDDAVRGAVAEAFQRAGLRGGAR